MIFSKLFINTLDMRNSVGLPPIDNRLYLDMDSALGVNGNRETIHKKRVLELCS